MRSALRRVRELDGEVNLAIVMAEDKIVPEGWQRFARDHYAAALEEEGVAGELWTCRYSDFTEKDLRFYYRGRRVHAILEQRWGFVPLPVLFSWIDRGLVVFNGPTCLFLNDKRNLGLPARGAKESVLLEVSRRQRD